MRYLGGDRISSHLTHRYKGAYCTIWEKEPIVELFGEMEVMAETLPAMADKIISAENN